MSSPISRRSILSRLVTSSLRSQHLGLDDLAAANASSCRVSSAARWPPSSICSRSSRSRSSLLRSEQKLRQRQDHRQQVVEVVSHAAGEPADALHALGQEHLLLQVLALGDVADRGHPQRAVADLDGLRAHLDGDDGAVGAQQAVLVELRRSRRQVRDHLGARLGRDEVDRLAADQIDERRAHDLAQPCVPIDDAAVVGDRQSLECGVDEGAHAQLGVAADALRLAPLGRIAADDAIEHAPADDGAADAGLDLHDVAILVVKWTHLDRHLSDLDQHGQVRLHDARLAARHLAHVEAGDLVRRVTEHVRERQVGAKDAQRLRVDHEHDVRAQGHHGLPDDPQQIRILRHASSVEW